MGSSPVPLPRLRTNLRKFFPKKDPNRPSTPLSMHCNGFVEAAAEASAAPSFSASRVKKRKRIEPVLRYALPHLVEKLQAEDKDISR
ncbi:hypothetical protein V8E52_006084 [Russula decolorans]